MLTYDEAHELFCYEDGILYWKKPGIKRVVGKVAGHTDSTGYTRICISYKMYLRHRIIWLMHNGSWPENSVDHIDGNPKNDRIENLRDVTHTENLRNNWKRRNNCLTEEYKTRKTGGLKERLD